METVLPQIIDSSLINDNQDSQFRLSFTSFIQGACINNVNCISPLKDYFQKAQDPRKKVQFLNLLIMNGPPVVPALFEIYDTFEETDFTNTNNLNYGYANTMLSRLQISEDKKKSLALDEINKRLEDVTYPTAKKQYLKDQLSALQMKSIANSPLVSPQMPLPKSVQTNAEILATGKKIIETYETSPPSSPSDLSKWLLETRDLEVSKFTPEETRNLDYVMNKVLGWMGKNLPATSEVFWAAENTLASVVDHLNLPIPSTVELFNNENTRSTGARFLALQLDKSDLAFEIYLKMVPHKSPVADIELNLSAAVSNLKKQPEKNADKIFKLFLAVANTEPLKVFEAFTQVKDILVLQWSKKFPEITFSLENENLLIGIVSLSKMNSMQESLRKMILMNQNCTETRKWSLSLIKLEKYEINKAILDYLFCFNKSPDHSPATIRKHIPSYLQAWSIFEKQDKDDFLTALHADKRFTQSYRDKIVFALRNYKEKQTEYIDIPDPVGASMQEKQPKKSIQPKTEQIVPRKK
jgi:hypothetical protein